MSITATLVDATLADVTALDHAHGHSWSTSHNTLAVGRLVMQTDDPDLASIQRGSLIRFDLGVVGGGTHTLGIMVVESDPSRPIDQGEGAGQTVELSGRELLVEWERALAQPPYGTDWTPWADQRVFGPMDRAYDAAAWTLPVATRTNTGQVGVPPGEEVPPFRPEGFPTFWHDLDGAGADYIWDRSSAGPNVPQGDVHFRRTFNLAAAKRVHAWVHADDAYELWVDGVYLLEDPGDVSPARYVELDLPAGDHLIYIRGTNNNNLKAMVLFSLAEIAPVTRHLQVPDLLHSDDTNWRCLGYPDPAPGMTAGQIATTLLSDAQGMGQLSGWSIVGGGTTDADGQSWGEIVEAVDIGRPLADVLTQMGDSVLEFAADAGARTLRLWKSGGRGAVTAVALTAGQATGSAITGNLVSLEHHPDGKVVNHLMIRYGAGWTEIEDATSVAAHGRRSEEMRLEGVLDTADAQRIGQAFLAAYKDPRLVTSAAIDPESSADQPFVAFGVGDWVDCPDESEVVVSMRVRSLSATQDADGLVSYEAELRNTAYERQTAFTRTLGRALRGTVGGRSSAASFTSPGSSPPLTEDIEQIPPFTFVAAADGPAEYRTRATPRIVGAVITGDNSAATGTTTVELLHDGAVFATISLLAAENAAEYDGSDFASVQTERRSALAINRTADGGHTGVVVQMVSAR